MKKKKILIVLSFVFWLSFSAVLGLLNPRYKNIPIFLKLFSAVYSELTISIVNTFGLNVVCVMIYLIMLLFLLIPSYAKIFVKTIQTLKNLKNVCVICLTGQSFKEKDKEYNLFLEENFDRNYQRALAYCKKNDITLMPLVCFLIYFIYLPLVTAGICYLPFEVINFKTNFFWLNNVLEPNTIVYFLFMAYVIFNLVKTFIINAKTKWGVGSVLLYILLVISYSLLLIRILNSLNYIIIFTISIASKYTGGKNGKNKKDAIALSNDTK